MKGRASVVLAVWLAAALVHAQMFKCVDERGVTHYTDKPRPGCKGGEVDIRGQPPISGKVTPREDLSSEEREFRRRQIQRERGEERDKQQAAARERRCASMHAEVQRLQTARRVATVDAKGQRTFLDDAAREQRVQQLQAEIERQCR